MSEPGLGLRRQTDVYLAGVRGIRQPVPFSFAKLESAAKRRLTREAYAYIAGGAGLEGTIDANRAAFDRRRIVPRMMRDVSERDLSIELFGRRLPTPFLTAPIGVLELAHHQSDVAVAKAAASEGVPMIFSNQASRSMEDCAAVMGDAPRWFQLYWSTSNELVSSFVSRAEACGCDAIVVTLDTTMLGWRCRDLDLAYLPFAVGKGIAQYTSDPVFLSLLKPGKLEGGKPTLKGIRSMLEVNDAYPGGVIKNMRSGMAIAAVRTFLSIYSRPSLTWDDLPFLRGRTKLPILLKGIQHPEDGRLAVEHGVDGVVVSTHGGRQVDGALGSLDSLPGVVAAVDDRIPVLLDSGIRGGADVFKALALGARAVLIGRPYVYGLALAGEEGVRSVLKNFAADLDLTMGLAGCRSIAEIGADTLEAE